MDEYPPDEGERVPPHDLLAEGSVLGSMMLSRDALWDVLQVLEPGDFYQPKHQLVFSAAMGLTRRNEPVDAISVVDELRQQGELDRSGGPVFIHDLVGIPSTPANAVWHADIVKAHAVRRRLIEAASRISNTAFSGVSGVNEQVEMARSEVDGVAGKQQADIRPVGDSLDAVVERLHSQPKVVPTPWHELNELMPGFEPGKSYVVGARPGEGKTIVGMQIAMELVRQGPVAFVSLEMTREELLMRMLAAKANVHMGSMSRSSLSDDEWERVARARPLINSMPLFIDDRAAMTITQIKAFARSVSRKGPLAGVVVDYLQLISGASDERKRFEVVTEITRQMKIMSKDLGVPVITLSQLNRGTEAQGKRRPPTLADLRESGSIEQDADSVILLQRELEQDDKPGDRLRMHVAKNRSGKTGYRTLRWNAAYARIDSWNRYGLGELPIPD